MAAISPLAFLGLIYIRPARFLFLSYMLYRFLVVGYGIFTSAGLHVRQNTAKTAKNSKT